MIAAGAERVLAARQKGGRPGEAVVVSLVGSLPVEWLVQADLDTEYDWMPLVDLDVWVIAESRHSSRLKSFLWQFRKHRPRCLWVLLDDKDKAYEIYFSLKLESIKNHFEAWEWEMEKQPLLKVQTAAMKLITAIGEQA